MIELREERDDLAKKYAALEKGSGLPEASAEHSRELGDLKAQHHAEHSVLQKQHDYYKTAYEDLDAEYDQLCKDTKTEKKDLTKQAKILELAVEDQSSSIQIKKERINYLSGQHADLKKAVREKEQEIEDKDEKVEEAQEIEQQVQLTMDVWLSVADCMVAHLHEWESLGPSVAVLKGSSSNAVVQDTADYLAKKSGETEQFLQRWNEHKDTHAQRIEFVQHFKKPASSTAAEQ